MRPRQLFLYLLLPLFAASCVKAPPKTAQSPARLQETSQALERYRGEKPIHGLSAFAQVRLQYRGKSESFDAALLLEAPDRMRIELIDDLGQTRARLVADGRTVLWEDLREGTRESYAQEEGALNKALRLPTTVEDFIARMTLQIPPDATLGVHLEQGQELIERGGDRISWDPGAARLTAYSRKKSGSEKKLRYSVQYQEYSSSPAFPRKIFWEFFSPSFQLTLTLSEVTLNGALPQGRFNTQPSPADES